MNKLAKAVFTLTSFSVIDRVLGFIFKIYLSREMGAADLGVYQVALSFFFVLMTLTTSGLPLIEGKMTAAYDAKGLGRKTGGLISAGLIINAVMSVLLVGLVFALHTPLKSVISSDESMGLLFVLLPSLLFCSIAAAFRGSFWGKERYAAVSIIELLEQVARILLCVVMFLAGMGKTYAATLSLTIAMIFSCVLTVVYYFAQGGRLNSPRGQLKPLFSSSAPISVLRASTSLVNSLLAVAVPFLFSTTGLNAEESLAMFGATVGMAMPLIYLPITVIGSLSYAMIPTLAKADAEGNKAEVRRQAETAIKFSAIVAALFIPLFGGVGMQSGLILYDNAEAGRFLQVGGLLLLPVALESITSSMMNSLGMEKQGFVNYIIGSVVMFGVMFCFYGRFTPESLCLAWFISLTLSTLLDVVCIKKHTGISLRFLVTMAACIALAVPCTFLTRWTASLLFFMPELLAVMIAAALGCGSMFLLFVTFGFLDNYLVIGKHKKRDKSRKRLHIKA